MIYVSSQQQLSGSSLIYSGDEQDFYQLTTGLQRPRRAPERGGGGWVVALSDTSPLVSKGWTFNIVNGAEWAGCPFIGSSSPIILLITVFINTHHGPNAA